MGVREEVFRASAAGNWQQHWSGVQRGGQLLEREGWQHGRLILPNCIKSVTGKFFAPHIFAIDRPSSTNLLKFLLSPLMQLMLLYSFIYCDQLVYIMYCVFHHQTRPCTTVRYSDVHVCIVWEGTFYCPEISKTSTVYVQKYSVCGLVWARMEEPIDGTNCFPLGIIVSFFPLVFFDIRKILKS